VKIEDKFVKFIPEFFQVTLNEDNFEETIFRVLAKIFPVTSGYLFYVNSDDLTFRFGYKSKLRSNTMSYEEFNDFVSSNQMLVVDLSMDGVTFAKLILNVNCEPSKEMKTVFNAAASIVANLVKDVEINSILKMQVEALRDGMNEVTRANELIKKQNKKILSAEKVKNEFFSNVSHQLRSPLNSIIGFADMLNSGYIGTLNAKQKDYISDIKISGIKLLEMVNEVLDISKIESKSVKLFKREFNLKLNIQEVLNILKPLYVQKNISVELDIPDNFNIAADYQKIQQVFFNLISNAIKFTPENDGLIRISAKISDDNAEISVKDNGIGIAKSFHKKIFKKFQQVSGQDSASTGLGLTIVKEIIRLHKGKILLNSDLGLGAEFVVHLPLS